MRRIVGLVIVGDSACSQLNVTMDADLRSVVPWALSTLRAAGLSSSEEAPLLEQLDCTTFTDAKAQACACVSYAVGRRAEDGPAT